MGYVLLAAFAVINLYTFAAMGIDKRRANQKQWRISERHFFTMAALGGSLGVLLAMQVWRHKRQKWAFKAPVYAIVLLQIAALGLYLRYLR